MAPFLPFILHVYTVHLPEQYWIAYRRQNSAVQTRPIAIGCVIRPTNYAKLNSKPAGVAQYAYILAFSWHITLIKVR